MTATAAQARAAMLAHTEAHFALGPPTAGVKVLWPDRPGEPPDDVAGDPVPYMTVTILHNPGAGGQSSLHGQPDGGGKRRYTRFGTLTVQIFTVTGDGMLTADDFTDAIKAGFEATRLNPTGVVFDRVRWTEVGPSKMWTQTNLIAEFEYDEVR